MNKRKRFLLIFITLILSISIIGCNKKDEKNPFGDIDNYEEGKFNDSGYQSEIITDVDLTHFDDAFIKKFASNLIQKDYEVFDIEGFNVNAETSKYGEEAMYVIYIKDLPEINVYRFDKNSDELERISNTDLLNPLSNLGAKQNAIVYQNYVLAIDTVTEEVMNIFKETGKIVN